MLSTEKSSTTPSPKKKSELADFTAGEMKMIMASVLCIAGRLNTDKLGKLTGTKRNSAASRFPSIKRKLEKMFEDQLDTLDEPNDDAKERSPTNTRAKKRREKVVEEQQKPKVDTKVEPKSGEGTSTDSTLKVKTESGQSINSPVKVESDSESDSAKSVDISIKIKPEPID
ncbi:hypothetical protein PENNAL_c0020G04746 [Penicillium nalgiovense]|uniref:Uncharacterized protein n=1 Tax=Penicillium nalgiovense TaxID=60175 RepID=A0A1V6YIP0_PENNA|nr:hypothetical protein PENNAL_c0020G04746 [Penicillium nalgiovense]